MLKTLSYFPVVVDNIFKEYYSLENLLKLIFEEKNLGLSFEEYNLEKRLTLFESLCTFARDFLTLTKNKKECEDYQKVFIFYVLIYKNYKDYGFSL